MQEEKGTITLEEIIELCENFDKEVEEERKRREELGLVLCVVFKNELWDYGYNLPSGFFEIKKEELKDYIYKDKIDCLRKDEEDYFSNRTYKYICNDLHGCPVFYRDY
jgi:hypothetical protein